MDRRRPSRSRRSRNFTFGATFSAPTVHLLSHAQNFVLPELPAACYFVRRQSQSLSKRFSPSAKFHRSSPSARKYSPGKTCATRSLFCPSRAHNVFRRNQNLDQIALPLQRANTLFNGRLGRGFTARLRVHDVPFNFARGSAAHLSCPTFIFTITLISSRDTKSKLATIALRK